jgi:hypothetical protein
MGNDKFNLFYSLTVQMNQTKSSAVIINYPITLMANIKKGIGSTFNSANITVYNLGEHLRNAIAKPRYDTANFTFVSLSAGYSAGNLVEIFSGNILQAYSVRVGNNIETRILASEGVFAANNAFINKTYNKGFSLQDFALEIIGSLSNVQTPSGTVETGLTKGVMGNVGAPEKIFTRGITINSNTWTLANKYFKHQFFIDNGFINLMNVNDAFVGFVPLISSATGLLNTPVIQDNSLDVEVLFEPQIVVGQVIEVRSTTFRNINGQWKVQGLSHDLTISEGTSSQGITKLNLFLGTTILNIISNS